MATDSSTKYRRIDPGHLRLFFIILTGVLLTSVLLWYNASSTLWKESQRQRLAGMQAACGILRDDLARSDLTLPNSLDSLARVYGQITGMRVTLIARDGKVLGDSEQLASLMENHSDRPEVQEALAGRTGVRHRTSPTLNQSMMYIALPPTSLTAPVVRISSHLTGNPTLSIAALIKVFLLATIALFLTYALAIFLFRPYKILLTSIRSGLHSVIEGKVDRRLPAASIAELSDIETAFATMATTLQTRFEAYTHQIGELEALLGSMVEGVLAINEEERIININRAASRMLGVDANSVRERMLLEAIRNHDLSHFTAMVTASGKSLEHEIFIPAGERRIQLHGSPLINANGKMAGVVVALHDVTRLRRLETVRRDFVANVSHELRTPITSIKGFVETLRDGAIEDHESAHKFIEIISRQVDRLNAIIEDLLALARLEEDSSGAGIEFQKLPLIQAVKSAIESLQTKAAAKEVEIYLGEGLATTVHLNAPLIEQAVVNLVDNAINYSPTKSRITVNAQQDGGFVLLTVSDQGGGIAPEHLPRLFERFYRVDRDRSRKLGGTGLGLSIVKHIARAHKGKVSVKSAVGRGSSFTIHLPTTVA